MVNLLVEDLAFAYAKDYIIKDISFSVAKGEILCLVGSNGAGKTTLLKCLNHLLKPKIGQIFIKNKNINDISARELAQEVAYVPQTGEQKFPATVFESILLGRRPYIKWKPSSSDFDIVSKVIKKLDLEKLSSKDIKELSGGEMQKVLIARALAQETGIVLLDEPSNHLDLRHQLELMELIKELVHQKNMTAVISTHDLNLAARYADKVLILKDGKVFALGEVDIISKNNIRKVYNIEADIGFQEDKPYVIPIKSLKKQ